MRTLICLICWILPAIAAAEPSILEFTVMNDGALGGEIRYRIILDENDSRRDRIERNSYRDIWETPFTGTITSVDLPDDARIDDVYGPRATAKSLVNYSGYSLASPTAGGLRLSSGNKLVLLTPQGAAEVPWPGRILDVQELDTATDTYLEANFYIFSIKAEAYKRTFIVVNDDFKNPHVLLESFRAEPTLAYIEEGIIHIDELGKTLDPKQLVTEKPKPSAAAAAKGKRFVSKVASTYATDVKARKKLFREWKDKPSPTAVMDVLIAQLDDRLFSRKNPDELAKKAIRGIMMREFPRLMELEKTDPVVAENLRRAVNALTNLWLMRKLESAENIRHIVVQRLEAVVENRAKCELALLTLEGPGSHSLSFDKGEALRALNALHRRLYRQ